jgi:pilus assembly protein Flp/PilA
MVCSKLKSQRRKDMERIKRFFRDEEGATMVEYGLMLALIAVVCIAAVTVVGTKASGMFSTIASSL